MDWLAFSHGAALCASLIVTIGAQNAFVLRQGIMRSHVGKIVRFGIGALRRALKPGHAILNVDRSAGAPAQRALPIVLMTLALTWLNPHVYLDTFLLIGTAGAREAPTGRVAFALGAMAVSAVWFVLLGYGARALAPLFRRATAWRVLDGAIGSMILLLAVMQLR